MNKSRTDKLYPLPVVRKEQIMEIITAESPEDRLFRFLQFTRWLENMTKRPWKHPLDGIGTELFYGAEGCNLNHAHRRLSQVNRVWARYGHVVIRQLKADKEEFQRRILQNSNPGRRLPTARVAVPTSAIQMARNEHLRDRTPLSDIRDSDKPEYMNLMGQVFGVVQTQSGETVLRIWDGTQHRCGGFHPRKMYVTLGATISSVHTRPNQEMLVLPDSCVVDIVCYGNWATEVLSLTSGQMIVIRNVHLSWPVNSHFSVPRKLCLHGGSANGRGIFVLPPSFAARHSENLLMKLRTFQQMRLPSQPMMTSVRAPSVPNRPIYRPTPRNDSFNQHTSTGPSVMIIEHDDFSDENDSFFLDSSF